MKTISQRESKGFKTISVFTLMMFFCAFLLHSHHVSEYSAGNGLQECHVCHQGLDSAVTSSSISLAVVIVSFYSSETALSEVFQSPYHGLAQLRAPPVNNFLVI